MILYFRDKKDIVSYYQVKEIHVEETLVCFAIYDDETIISKKDISFASLRTEDGRLLQIIKE